MKVTGYGIKNNKDELWTTRGYFADQNYMINPFFTLIEETAKTQVEIIKKNLNVEPTICKLTITTDDSIIEEDLEKSDSIEDQKQARIKRYRGLCSLPDDYEILEENINDYIVGRVAYEFREDKNKVRDELLGNK